MATFKGVLKASIEPFLLFLRDFKVNQIWKGGQIQPSPLKILLNVSVGAKEGL